MTLKQLENIIVESITQILDEGLYDTTPTPHFSKTDNYRNIGSNPLTVDNGNHVSSDSISQPSTIDFNGERLDAEPIYLSDIKFTIYKIKNFGNDGIESTLSFFGRGASGEKLFRNAIDTVYGAARRNGRNVIFRTISSTDNPARRNSVYKCFWEFSFDNGNTWNIMKPNPVQNMTQSKLIQKQ